MPVTTVDEEDSRVFWQYHVRLAWQVGAVKNETEAETMKDRTNREFRCSILASYSGHAFTSLRGGQRVGQKNPPILIFGVYRTSWRGIDTLPTGYLAAIFELPLGH